MAGDVPQPPLRILVVEDEALIALELECLLEDLGHRVVGVARTSTEAVTLGHATDPDLALVDIHLLDGPTGVDVARSLSANPRMTVLFMTANSKRIPPDFAGALGVIAKPYSERVVVNALTDVIDHRAGRTPTTGASDGFSLSPAGDAHAGEPSWNSRAG